MGQEPVQERELYREGFFERTWKGQVEKPDSSTNPVRYPTSFEIRLSGRPDSAQVAWMPAEGRRELQELLIDDCSEEEAGRSRKSG